MREKRRIVSLVAMMLLCVLCAPVAARAEVGDPLGVAGEEGTCETTLPEGIESVLVDPDVVLGAQSATWHRLAGANRYDTMAAIVSEGFGTSEWAVVASGEAFPDALSASALAGVRDCPVVLTAAGDALSPQAREQIERLGVTHVYVMGGTAAISEGVEAELVSMGIEVVRVAGSDRSATSVDAFAKVRAAEAELEAESVEVAKSDTLVVAAGANFPDALSIAPWSYLKSAPIVLCQGDGTLTDETVAAVHADGLIKNVIIVGGEAVVSNQVMDQLGGSYAYTRLAGDNRYETSRKIAEWELQNGMTWTSAAVASGQNFPDALAGAALSGIRSSILLVANSYDDATLELLRAHRDDFSEGFIYGGQASVSMDDPAADRPQDPMSLKAQEYASATEWLILVDCSANVCGIYHGSQNNWDVYAQVTVTTGAPWSPTVKGIFTVGGRGEAFGGLHDGMPYTCYYWTRFYGDYLFHSVLYHAGTYNEMDGRLGINASAGCVRMPLEWCKWINDYIPDGTTVVTYA